MDTNQIKTYKRIVSIDPGGFEMGVAVFEQGILQTTHTYRADDATSKDRRFRQFLRIEPVLRNTDLVISEEPFLRGTANINMQRMLGVFEWLTGGRAKFINPSAVKRWMGGGKLEKQEVAKATLAHLSEPEKKIVEELIFESRWNETDAVAVALAWFLKQQNEGTQMAKKATKATKTMKNKSGNKSAKVGKSGMKATNMPKMGKGKGAAC